ncbi:hypothetical protein MRB53_026617 [Persea americana]|uniref:Uncharacterized protein n=1 Tax=Persea americana TaxID=3435 RepID=A0ACC2LIJ7_PERAE|nr:hypothetical protein MRB53_026617 [Persea americana]
MSEEFEFGRWKWTGSRLYVVGTGSLFVCEFEDREGFGERGSVMGFASCDVGGAVGKLGCGCAWGRDMRWICWVWRWRRWREGMMDVREGSNDARTKVRRIAWG